jgi:hypothetical protein
MPQADLIFAAVLLVAIVAAVILLGGKGRGFEPAELNAAMFEGA